MDELGGLREGRGFREELHLATGENFNKDNRTAEKMAKKEKRCIQNGIVVHSLTHTRHKST